MSNSEGRELNPADAAQADTPGRIFDDVEAMSPEEIHEEFQAGGFDVQQIMQSIANLTDGSGPVETGQTKKESPSVRLHVHPHHEEAVAGAARGLSNMRLATRPLVPTNQQTAPERGFLFSSWSGTHEFGDRLRRLRHEAAALARRQACLEEGFAEVEIAVFKVYDAAVDFDCVWPAAEAIEEAAAEVAPDIELHEPFAIAVGELSSRACTPVKCIIVHSLSEVLGRGARGEALAMRAYRELLHRDTSPEVRLLVRCAADLHAPLGQALRDELRPPLDPAMRSLRADIEGAYEEAWTRLCDMRERKTEHRYFTLPTIARLFDHQSRGAMSSLLSMYALGQIFRHTTGLILRQHELEHQFAVRRVFVKHLLSQLHEHSRAHFLTVEMFESIRDRYPRFAASVMAELVPKLGPRGRQSLFVCLTEGYEAQFAGATQQLVPRFVIGSGSPRFVAPGYPLDLFGELICKSPVAPELTAEMEWMNRRIVRWHDPVHGVPAAPPKRRPIDCTTVEPEDSEWSRMVAECLSHAPQ